MPQVLKPFACALFAALAAASAARADAARVRTDAGAVIGTDDGKTQAFKGIPYAAPPVGDLRWRPPAPALAWKGELQALDYGHSCPQPEAPAFVAPSSRAYEPSEDCLTLNVWAPVRAARAPVVVWIHGGGNTGGSSGQTFYDGAAFARDGVALVSINYRLGLLGFFAHPALGQGPADFGLMDQIAALQWVKRNIAAFGGDPANVTVMGESAGGQDILALAASPLARGLFAKAIVESAGGGWDHYPTLADAQARGAAIAAKLGARTAADLRSLKPEALVEAAGDSLEHGPVLDGVVLSETPIQAIKAGHVPAIPLLIGTNSWEGSLLPPRAKLADIVDDLTDPEKARLVAYYKTTDDDGLARLVFRDAYFAAPARWVAADWPAPAYLYRFDYVAGVLRERRPGATHGSEIPFVFQTASFARGADDAQVSATAHGCWTAFIKTGVPACPGAPAWPVYKAADDRLMRFGAAPEVMVNPSSSALDRMIARDGPDAKTASAGVERR